MQPASPGQIEAARTAAAVLYLVDGPSGVNPDLLQGLAPGDQLEGIVHQLCSGNRDRRVRMLASYLSRLVVELETWSMP